MHIFFSFCNVIKVTCVQSGGQNHSHGTNSCTPFYSRVKKKKKKLGLH